MIDWSVQFEEQVLTFPSTERAIARAVTDLSPFLSPRLQTFLSSPSRSS